MRSRLSFAFFDTEEQVAAFVADWNTAHSAYMRKHHPPQATPWSSSDGREQKIIVWYYQI